MRVSINALAPGKEGVEDDENGEVRFRTHGVQAEPRLAVEEMPQAEGSNEDHGKLVRELGLEKKCRVKGEAPQSD